MLKNHDDADVQILDIKWLWILLLTTALLSVAFLSAWILTIIIGLLIWVKTSSFSSKSKWRKRVLIGVAWSSFSLLIALSLGAADKDRRSASEEACRSQLKAVFGHLSLYGRDIPLDKSRWCDDVELTMNKRSLPHILRCPGRFEAGKFIYLIDVRLCYSYRNKDLTRGPCDYALNKHIDNESLELVFRGLANDPNKNELPPDMVLLFESTPGWNQIGGAELLTVDQHEGRGCNVLFCNGDVRFVKTEDVSALRWNDRSEGHL